MKKWLITLGVAMLLCLLPASALAGVTWKDGLERYTESVTKNEFGGTWSYDAENRTLTLDNIHLDSRWTYTLQISHVDTLILIGDNYITCTEDGGRALNVRTDLTIAGPGSLYIESTRYGLEVDKGVNITIDGAKLTAKVAHDAAIRANGGTIEITNGARVSVQGILNTRGPIICGPDGKIIVRNGSSLSSSGLNSSDEFYPVQHESTLVVEDTSDVTLTGIKPFHYDLSKDLKADSLSFTFPQGKDTYMTSTPGASACRYSFAVNEAEQNGVYTLTVQGKERNDVRHSWGDWTDNGDGTHSRVCANNAHHVENGNCNRGGTADGYYFCTRCGSRGEEAPTVPAVPETGDGMNIVLWTVMAVISAAGLLMLSRRKHKEY